MAKTFDGKRVSDPWWHILTCARNDGVQFRLNSGRRMMVEQWWLYRHQPPTAAYPSRNAPHIWTGRANHALDVDTYYGAGAAGLARWLRGKGLHPVFNVPGETWHMWQDNEAELEQVAARLRQPRTLRRGMRGDDVRRLQVLLRGTGHYDRKRVGNWFGPGVRSALTRFQRGKGIKPDGVYGPTTRRLLERAHDRKQDD